MVPGIWAANHSMIEQIPMIWIQDTFAIQIPTILGYLDPNLFVQTARLNCEIKNLQQKWKISFKRLISN